MKLYYLRKTRITILGFYSKMSILASKPKFTSWDRDFDGAGWGNQDKVTKLFVKILKFCWDMRTFHELIRNIANDYKLLHWVSMSFPSTQYSMYTIKVPLRICMMFYSHSVTHIRFEQMIYWSRHTHGMHTLCRNWRRQTFKQIYKFFNSSPNVFHLMFIPFRLRNMSKA